MEQKLTAAKATIAAVATTVCSFLGWRGLLALVWITTMLLDYLSGSAAAMKAGDWASSRAREGLWHKCGMIIAVMVAALFDGVITIALGNIPAIGMEWPGAMLPLVLAWYILTELGSILENAVKLGAAVPQWLTKMLKSTVVAVDLAGDRSPENEKEKNKK